MPANIYYETDADMSLLEDKKIAIIGYGSQGHAPALTLQDSGLEVAVGLFQSRKSWEAACEDGRGCVQAQKCDLAACEDDEATFPRSPPVDFDWVQYRIPAAAR